MIQTELKCLTEIRIRFSEVDSMGVVWHGNYIRYFEDGRESFGNSMELTIWISIAKMWWYPS
jgi:acyl-CoA thioester hydrolase